MQPETATSFRLSPQQERLWLAEDEPTGRSLGLFQLTGPLDTDRLREALLRVVERHEILRTTFQRQAGMRLPLQVVHRELAPQWEVHDLTGLGPDEAEARRAQLAAAAESGVWNLADGPLVRALVLSLAPDRSLLVLSVAAVCADAASVVTIAREVAAHYANASVAVEPLQYADFAEWQHELLAADDEDAAAAKEFWSREVGAATPAVPFLGPAGAKPVPAGPWP